MKANNRMFVALDVPAASQALELVRALSSCTRMFKIGSQLFTAEGPELVRKIVASGARVFLDLKFHDIPNTVGAAAAEAARLGVFMFNVHAAGGHEMLRRAVERSSETAEAAGHEKPRVLGVTMLTSADASTLTENGITRSMDQQVASLAKLTADCGLDGVVTSPHEVGVIRSAVSREGFLVVTPGIRPADKSADDQKRVMTPTGAIKAGADYIVVGRAITTARDPAEAATRILKEIEGALA
jgi:orotidine-5'-phosphate decarboxylase